MFHVLGVKIFIRILDMELDSERGLEKGILDYTNVIRTSNQVSLLAFSLKKKP